MAVEIETVSRVDCFESVTKRTITEKEDMYISAAMERGFVKRAKKQQRYE